MARPPSRQPAPTSAHIPSITFSPPPLPVNHVHRARLETLLGPKVGGRLSLVVGPPGSGKTTLVRSYTEHVAASWSWVMVDSRSGHHDRFWATFVRAVQLAHPQETFDTVDVIGNERVDTHVVLSTLADDLMRLGDHRTPSVVVLDDAHLLDDDCWAGLEWLIGHKPQGLHLILVSRADPPFAIARWRAAGDVAEVRAADLAFTADEAVALFEQGLPGRSDCASLAAALHERTEGWPAGLRLALLALQRGSPGEQLLDQFSGTQSSVAELLIAEVLDNQTSDMQDFLRTTSILDVLQPDLCRAVTGRADCRRVLRELARDQVFITPIEGRLDHYRYHPMLADLLRFELRAEDRHAAGRLHQRAARWFEGEGRYAEAIEHAIAGSEYALASDLVIKHQRSLTADGRRADVARWLLAVPEAFVMDDPDRAVQMCAALLFTGRVEWAAWHRRLPAIVGPDRPELLARVHLFGAVGLLTQGRLEEYRGAISRALDLRQPGHVDPFDEIVDAWRARLLSLEGRHREAIELATSFVQRERQLVTDAPALSLLAGVLYQAGDPGALSVAERSLQQWREMGEPDLLGMVDALCVLATDALAAGDAERSELFAGWAVAATADPPPHLLTIRAAIAMAGVDRAAGRERDATSMLTRIYHEARFAGVQPLVLGLIDTDPVPVDHLPLGDVARDEVGLTDRERGILRLLSSHLTFPEIGRELFISRYTVKTHVTRIYRKLGVTSRSAAIDEARRLGLLSRSA